MGTFRRWMVHTTGSWPGPSSWSLAERVPGLTVRAGGAVWQGEGRARADLTATGHPLTQQMEYLAGTLPGSSTLTTLTAWPHRTGTWSATGRWGPPSARASCCARPVPMRGTLSGTRTCDAASRHPPFSHPKRRSAFPSSPPPPPPPLAFFSIK